MYGRAVRMPDLHIILLSSFIQTGQSDVRSGLFYEPQACIRPQRARTLFHAEDIPLRESLPAAAEIPE